MDFIDVFLHDIEKRRGTEGENYFTGSNLTKNSKYKNYYKNPYFKSHSFGSSKIFIHNFDMDFYFSEEQLIMVCIDLFFTSSDTTSAALEFAILYMTLNPHISQKVRAEIDNVLGDKLPNLEDRAKYVIKQISNIMLCNI